MKKALLGPFHLGGLNGLAKALQIASEVTSQPGTNVSSIFYATAFQAGVDHFVLTYRDQEAQSESQFVEDRISALDRRIADKNWKLVHSTFSRFLPEDWEDNEACRPVWAVHAFVTDLLDAMDSGCSLLSPLGIPDISEVEQCLPGELAIPITNLIRSVDDLLVPSPIPIKVISREAFDRYNDILVSDLFQGYSSQHEALEDAECDPAKALPSVVSAGRSLFAKNKSLLSIRKTTISLLEITPQLIDTAFGAMPGAISEAAAKLGLNLLENRRRIVVYDFEPLVHEILLTNLARLLKTAGTQKKG